jgi:selenocysteine lyase/cysteine desulfurase
MPIDLAQARRDTPATNSFLHFNNAGAALMPTPVLAAQLRHLQLEADTGGYEAAAAAYDQMESVYTSIARLLNADPTEIASSRTPRWPGTWRSIR